jgi:hypothetical protein
VRVGIERDGDGAMPEALAHDHRIPRSSPPRSPRCGEGRAAAPGLNWVTPSTIQPNTTYNVNDALQDAGGSWRNILSYTAGATPTVPSQDSTHWTFVSQQGLCFGVNLNDRAGQSPRPATGSDDGGAGVGGSPTALQSAVVGGCLPSTCRCTVTPGSRRTAKMVGVRYWRLAVGHDWRVGEGEVLTIRAQVAFLPRGAFPSRASQAH